MTMSSQAFQAVNWFRDAAPYINQHRGKTFVVYFSGEAIERDNFEHIIHDLALLHALGIRLVLVAGARPQINQRLALENITPEYAQGLRITDEESLTAVLDAVGRVRVLVEAKLSLSLVNTPMSGSEIKVCSGNFISARPKGVIDGTDFGHTGEVRKVATHAIRHQLDGGQCVLLSTLGYSPTGEVFNLSAEAVATATAIALQADKLIFFSDDATEWELPKQMPSSELSTLLNHQPEGQLDELGEHLLNAHQALAQGVNRCHIISSHADGAILIELFSRDGAGLLISNDEYDDLRPARTKDIAGILSVLAPLEISQALVKRSAEQLELEIDHFHVIERDGTIIGCVAFYPYPQESTGELACLAVDPRYHGNGRGDLLLEHVEKLARAAGLKEIFVLSTQTMHWFQERGFVAGDMDDLPLQRASLYNYQRLSKIFTKSLKKA